jgi:hypothetical protein
MPTPSPGNAGPCVLFFNFSPPTQLNAVANMRRPLRVTKLSSIS